MEKVPGRPTRFPLTRASPRTKSPRLGTHEVQAWLTHALTWLQNACGCCGRSSQGMVAAMTDMWLLSECDALVVTSGSTFGTPARGPGFGVEGAEMRLAR